jgi:hypothetical protein
MHPDLFADAVQYEQDHEDGRKYFWNQDESLLDLLSRKEQIIRDHEKALKRYSEIRPNRPLVEVLTQLAEEQNDMDICAFCHL